MPGRGWTGETGGFPCRAACRFGAIAGSLRLAGFPHGLFCHFFGGGAAGCLGLRIDLQLADAFFVQREPCAFREIGEFQGADADAHQLLHLIAEGLEHHPDLPFQTGLEHDAVAARGKALHLLGPHAGLLNVDAGEKEVEVFVQHRLVGGDDVFLLHQLRGVHQGLREIPIIGEDQQALRIPVQAADMMEVLQDRREDGVNRVAAEFILAGADVAARLVEHHRLGLLGLDALAIDTDEVVRLHALGGIEADLAIDFHVAFLHQGVAGAAGADAAGGEEFVQSGAFGHGNE